MSNVRAMIERQTTPASLILLLMALYVLVPPAWDWVRGEPRVANKLSLFVNSQNEIMVEDVVTTPSDAHGVRANILEDTDGSIICSASHQNTWRGERKKNWTLPAFAGCNFTPMVPFRVCSKWGVESNAGSRRDFGPFCSEFIFPTEDKAEAP